MKGLGVFWHRFIDQQVYLLFSYSKANRPARITFNVTL